MAGSTRGTFVPSERSINELSVLSAQDSRWWQMWGQMETSFKVRGKHYMSDGVKFTSREPLARLVRCDFWEINIQLPAHKKSSTADGCMSLVMYLALPAELGRSQEPDSSNGELLDDAEVACLSLVRQFMSGDQHFCDSRLKVLPRVIEGPWAVEKAVGQTPAILGKKVKQRYFRGDGYLEVAVDVGSSSVAKHVYSAVRRFSTSVILDIGFVLQGEQEDELPERVLGGVRICRVDVNTVEKLSAVTAG